ncbi:hexokinase I [Suhomyces tanzawaensis NRRL Y-17324]|uniref:Phosphotransferase n=1 Tax=Suhomyces tanzawaensis NRRL Y-17324 TaxID=984487 RepID=A0A1E4SCQ3_9ASCO|nr:hexokinase I [Suhomyces tanzawaensis NRRL Y-17324]ODV77172.1 hexokinase I [Suhomyces tanzawaensis NRRL Y-17324]
MLHNMLGGPIVKPTVPTVAPLAVPSHTRPSTIIPKAQALALLPSSPDSLASSHHSPLASSPDSLVRSVASRAGAATATVAHAFTHNLNHSVLSSQASLLVDDFCSLLAHNSAITMLPNYNISPTGDEYGDFLCIDLGGSTLRVAVVSIDRPDSSVDPAERIHIITEQKWTIANDFKTINTNFFKFIAARINDTLQAQCVIARDCPKIKTGITWSFPLETTSHNNGRIVHVSKGYSIASDIYNRDLKSILEQVLAAEHGLNVDVKIILNDSLAVYSAGSFLDKYMKLALVLGTGFNMCCSLENNDAIHPDKTWSNATSGNKTLFNTELSLFGDHMLPYLPNKYDYIIEPRFENFQFAYKPYMTADPATNSILQPTELMTSGRYLTELTRLVVVDLIHAKEIFTQLCLSQMSPLLNGVYDGISGELLCFIAETDDLDAIACKLASEYQWPVQAITHNDVGVLKTVINCIIERAAFVVAISIVAFIKLLKLHNSQENIHDQAINIGYVGSVITYFNSYRELIKKYVNANDAIVNLGVTVDFKLVDNSSIIGAAIGAAYYS